MKKIIRILLAILLLAAVVVTSVFAAGEGASASVTSASGAPGQTVTVTLSFDGFEAAKSMAVVITTEDGLTMANSDSQWHLSGMLSTIDPTKKHAVWAAQTDTDVNCDALTLAFVVPTPTEGQTDFTYDFSLSAELNNGTVALGTATASGTIEVVNPATSLTLSKTELTLDLKDSASADLTATYLPANTTDILSWSSSDETVATVADGKVTGLKQGSAQITAKIGELTQTCNVTVTCSHDLEKTDAVASTCIMQGNNAYYTCSVCGDVFKEDMTTSTTAEAEKLPLGDHSYSAEWSKDDSSHWHECSVCHDADVNKDEAAHTYTDAKYTWGEDNAQCTATATCVCGATDTETVDSECTTTPASCWQDGSDVYTATFTRSWAAEQTTRVTLGKTGEHTYGDPTYAWEDYTACTATRKCTTEGCTETQTANAVITSETEAATCGANGKTTYTATFTVAWATAQTEEEILSATGDHKYTVSFAWGANNATCTATGDCQGCDKVVTETVDAVTAVTTAPTCVDMGENTHTATFTETWIPAADAEQKTTSEISATGIHSYAQNGSVVWTETTDGYTCTVAGKCANCTDAPTATATVTSQTTAPNCYQAGETVYTATFTEAWVTNKTATKTVSIPATEAHVYGTTAYAWVEYESCTATRTCTTEGCGAKQTAAAEITSETEAATCGAAGKTTYTATFDVDWAANQTKEETLAATGNHTYKVDFAWGESNATCKATGVCEVCDDEFEETVDAVTAVTTAPTCVDKGKNTHTATFTNTWIADKTQTTTSEIAATGVHTYAQDGEVAWTEAYACTVKGTCSVCDGTTTVTATVASQTTEPTCYQDGKTVYTATFTETWVTDKTATKEVTLAATNQHVYGTAAYAWVEYESCTATRTCTTEGCSAKETANAVIASETQDPTCGANGKTTYTATFEVNWAATQTKEETIAATGNHTWTQDGEAVWTESGDTYTCTANAKCEVCTNTTSATAVVTSKVTKENDCGNDGTRTYTAAFDASWAATATKDVAIPATGEHTYAADGAYIWNDALSICTVSGKCSVCGGNTVAGATITSEITTQPTCKDEGVRTYTATFAETWARTQTKTAPVAATGNHVGGGAWLSDDTNHWRVCATEGCDVITDEAAHSYEWKIDQDSTEDVTGLKHEECACGKKRSENTVIPLKPHVHIEIKHFDAVAATCTATGNVEYWTCGSHKCEGIYYAKADCSKTYEDIVLAIDPNNHGQTELRDAVTPNCYQSGYSGDTYCLSCGEMAQKGETLNATGAHVGDNVWASDADYHWQTCTTAGCGAAVSKTAHTFQWKVDKAATEDETGLKHEECACGYKRSENTEIPKLDHVHVQITRHAAVEATCVKEGSKEYWTCGSTKCAGLYYGDAQCQTLLETIVIPVDSNNHGTLETKDALEPTCSEAGYTGDSCCTVCKAVVTKGSEVPATGKHTPAQKYLNDETQHWQVCSHCGIVVDSTKVSHNFVWIVDKQPTEAATGLKHEECADCKYTRNADTVVDKLQHAPYLVSAKAATCTEDGRTEHFYCGSCGGYYASNNGKLGNQISYVDTVVAATGHTFGEDWLSDGDNHWHVCECGEIGDQAKHTLETVGAVEATDTTAGYTGDSVCSICAYVAATGESTNAKIVVEVKNEAGEVVHAAPVVDLVITNVDEVHAGEEVAISEEAEQALKAAHDELVAEDVKLSALAPELVAAVEEKGLDAAIADELILLDLFDVTILNEELEAYLNEEGHTIDLTFEAQVAADAHVFVMVYKESKWQMIENVVNNGDGTITCTFEHLCPVAILTVPGADTEAEETPAIVEEESSKGGFAWWILVIVVLVVVAGAIVAYVDKKRKAQSRRTRARGTK